MKGLKKMKHDAFLKRYITFVLAAAMLMYTASAYLPVNGEEAIYSKILRLHVIANSDSESDQQMKLEVRDAVLYELDRLYAENDVTTLDEAKAVIEENSGALTSAAEGIISNWGEDYNYSVSLELGREVYPTKSYGEITLPAGEYDSVIIKIGKAEGKNWWCVLFPTLCLAQSSRSEDLASRSEDLASRSEDLASRSEDLASRSEDAGTSSYVYKEDGEKFIAAGFTPDEIRIITESESDEIKVKFRILEIFGSLFEGEN